VVLRGIKREATGCQRRSKRLDILNVSLATPYLPYRQARGENKGWQIHFYPNQRVKARLMKGYIKSPNVIFLTVSTFLLKGIKFLFGAGAVPSGWHSTGGWNLSAKTR